MLDDSVKESLPIRLDASRNLFQVGLLLAGGLWALYLGKSAETRVDLTQLPEFITDAFPDIECAIAENFDRQDAPAAAVSAWYRLRYPREEMPEPIRDERRVFAQANERTRREMLVSSLTAMGKLTVISTPNEAAVIVDGIPWDDTTETSCFVDEGEHLIDVLKEGREPHHGKVKVTKRKERKYPVTLAPKTP